MKARTYLTVFGAALLLVSCGQDSGVREIRQLRTTGNFQQARERAIAILQDDPTKLDRWLEFAQTEVDLTRQSEREGDERTIDYLVEVSLICGGYYKFKHGELSREWRDVCRLAAAEATKQANKVLTTLNAQLATVNYLNQLLAARREDSILTGAQISAEHMVDSYRSNARTVVFQATLMIRLLEMLPEITTGSSALIISQIQSAESEWRQALQLPTDLVETMTDRANRAVDQATARVMGDLQTLGYFLAVTITDNGILQ